MEQEQKHRKWIHIPLVIVIFGLFAATAWAYFSQYDTFTRENLRAFIGGFGAWAPVVYAVIYVVSAPIPFLAPVLSAVGGLLFGTLWGTVLVLVIASVSALVPFSMARNLGREWVESKLQGKKMAEIYKQSQGGKGFTFVVLLRLIPLKAGNRVLGILCLRIEHGVSWFASIQRMQEAQERPNDQITFFWTFLDQAILIIEQARLRARATSNNE